MLGLWAWCDDLNVILFEFLDDDTKLAQSCRDWLCARRATDRDLESSSTRRKANAWTRARRATDRGLESSSTMKKVRRENPASVIPDKKRKSVMFVNLCGPVVFGINNRRKMFCNFDLRNEWFWNELTNFACNHYRSDGMAPAMPCKRPPNSITKVARGLGSLKASA